MMVWDFVGIGSCHDPEIIRMVRESENREDSSGNGWEDEEGDDDDTY